MKKLLFLIFALATACALAFSCSKEKEKDSGLDFSKAVQVKLNEEKVIEGLTKGRQLIFKFTLEEDLKYTLDNDMQTLLSGDCLLISCTYVDPDAGNTCDFTRTTHHLYDSAGNELQLGHVLYYVDSTYMGSYPYDLAAGDYYLTLEITEDLSAPVDVRLLLLTSYPV